MRPGTVIEIAPAERSARVLEPATLDRITSAVHRD
eukprot:COSAG06_NODE_39776_length_408_cov_137.207120_1_plen_34_part_01